MMAPSSVIVLDSDEETEQPTSKRKKKANLANVDKRQKLSHNPSTTKKHKPLIVALDSRLLLADKLEPEKTEELPKPSAIGSSAFQVHDHGNSNVSPSFPGDTTSGILDGTLRRFLDSSLLQDQSLMRMIDKMSPDTFLNSTSVLNESNINLSQLDVSQLLNASLLDQTFSLASEKANISYLDSLLASVEVQPPRMQAEWTNPVEVTLPARDPGTLTNQESSIPIPIQPCLETLQQLVPPNIAPPMPLLVQPFHPAIANQMLGSQLLGNLNLLAQLHLQSLLASTLHASSHMASLSNCQQQYAGLQNGSQHGEGYSFEKDRPAEGSTNVISIEPLSESPGCDPSGDGAANEGLGTSRSFVSIAPIVEEASDKETTTGRTDGLAASRAELLPSGDDGFDNRGVHDVCRSIENVGANGSHEDDIVDKLYDVDKLFDADDGSVHVDVNQSSNCLVVNVGDIPAKLGIIEEVVDHSVSTVNSFCEKLTSEDDNINNVGDNINNVGDNINNVGDNINNVGDNINNVGDNINNVGDNINNVGDNINIVGDNINNVGDNINNVGDNINNVGDNINNVGDNINNVGDSINNVGDCINNIEEINNVGDSINTVEEIINNVDATVNLVTATESTTEKMENVMQPLTPNVDDTSEEPLILDVHTTCPSSSGHSSINDDSDPKDESDDNNDADSSLHGNGNGDEMSKDGRDSSAMDCADDNLRTDLFEDSALASELSKFSDIGSTSSQSTENDSGVYSESRQKCDEVESKIENKTETDICKTIEFPAPDSSETSDSEIPVDIIQSTDEIVTEKSTECDKVSTRPNFDDLSCEVRSSFEVKTESIKKESICGDDENGIVSVKEDIKLNVLSFKKEVKSEPQDVRNREIRLKTLKPLKQEEPKTMEKPAIENELLDQGASDVLELDTGKSDHLSDEPENALTPIATDREMGAPSRRISIPLSVLRDLDISSFSASPNSETESVDCYNCRQNVVQFAKCSSAHNCCLVCLFDKIKIWLASNSKDVFACEHPNCTSFYKIAELRQVLPEMIVEIMEEKLEREYVASTKVFLKKVNSKLMPVAPLRLGTDDWWPQYDHWDQMDHNKPYCLIDISKSSKEFEKVSKLFHKTMTSPRAKIKAVRKLLNPTMWQYYCMRKEQSVRHLSHVKHQLERMLFHGIKRKFLDVACLENVDWRKCGISHGILFGDGTYFARDASYAHQYTDKCLPTPSRRECDVDEALNRCLEIEKENMDSTADPVKAYDNIKRLMSQRLWEILDDKTPQKEASLHPRFMLVARVFVGRYTVGRMNMRKPPPLDPADPYGPCYDSLVNYADRPTLFVMTDVNQHYPEYVIEYTNKPREKTSSTFSTESFWFD